MDYMAYEPNIRQTILLLDAPDLASVSDVTLISLLNRFMRYEDRQITVALINTCILINYLV